MVKVYDMVTYEVCEPDDKTSAARTSPARSTRVALPLDVGLQPLEHGTSRHECPFPPSLRDVDIAAFLSAIDTD